MPQKVIACMPRCSSYAFSMFANARSEPACCRRCFSKGFASVTATLCNSQSAFFAHLVLVAQLSHLQLKVNREARIYRPEGKFWGPRRITGKTEVTPDKMMGV
jgi:hypothetical protein